MQNLERCCIVAARFESDAGSQMALCGCFSLQAMHEALGQAFSHPLFAHLDESARFERLAQSVERSLLGEAGVACSGWRAKQESFAVDGHDEPVESLCLELHLSGSIDPRKARVIESALRSWLERVFPGSHCALPSARPVPSGTDDDLAALRAGWRAEAAARGISRPASAERMLPTPEEGSGFDGAGASARARRRK